MNEKEFLTTAQVASLLGVSRIAIFKKIKSGRIRAKKSGRNYLISRAEIETTMGSDLSERNKLKIDTAVSKVLTEYGQTIKLLGQE